jgi:hypothetical protein
MIACDARLLHISVERTVLLDTQSTDQITLLFPY